MTIHEVQTNRPTGSTLYAFPASLSLADWTASRIQLVEEASPNLGKYLANLNDSVDTLWMMFSGASQPAVWSDSIEYFNLAGSDAELSTRMLDVWKRLGLDSDNPLINSALAITAGAELQIDVSTNSSQTVLTRQ